MKKLILAILLGTSGLMLGAIFSVRHSDTNHVEHENSIPQLATLQDLSLPDVERNIRQGGEWTGKVVVVNHWATWCPPCLEEIPMLIEYQETMAQEGVQVVGIAHDQLETTLRFGDEIGISYPSLVAIVDGDLILKSHGNTGSGALPYTVIFDRQGKLVRTFLGKLSALELDQMVTPFL